MIDSRFDYILLLADKSVPIFFQKNIYKKSKNFFKYWNELGFSTSSIYNQNDNQSIYFHKSRKKNIPKDNNLIEYVVVPSFDNPRWIIRNEKNIIDNHSSIIKPSSFKARLIWFIAKIFNKVSFFNLLFNSRIILKNISIEDRYFDFSDSIANIIYTGAIGKFQKFTIELSNKNNLVDKYLKLATSDNGILRIKKEEEALKILNQKSFNSVLIPELLTTVNRNNFYGIVQSNIINNDCNVVTSLKDIDISAINLLYDSFSKNKKNIKDYYIELKREVNQKLKIFNDLDAFFERKNDIDIILAISHGDYIPWNRFIDENQIKIIDWEMFCLRPIFYDIYYFLIHEAILINNESISNINDRSLYLFDKINNINLDRDTKMTYFLIISLEIYSHYKKNETLNDQKFLIELKKNISYLKNKILN